MSEHAERIREEERARLARELHDELGQLLTGIKLDFGALLRRLHELKTPGDVVDRLQSAVGQIDIGIAMVRRIAADLRPASLDHHDLGGAIEYEARRLEAQSGLHIRVTNRIDSTVPPEQATAAFRILKEALTNAVRHSNATSVSVRISSTAGGKLVLGVKDNGIGMAQRLLETGRCLGLLGMRERARALGGDVRITSTKGRGTLVTMSVPLRLPVRRT